MHHGCYLPAAAGSGGSGRYHGGDGVVRDIEFLRPLTAGILSERRAVEPFGLLGGGPGQRGLNLLVRQGGRVVNLGGKATVKVEAGGAGWWAGAGAARWCCCMRDK